MIVKEFYRTREDNINLYRTYSDQNFKIQKVGTNEIYTEAIDIEDSIDTYIETNEVIEVELTMEEKAKAYDTLIQKNEDNL